MSGIKKNTSYTTTTNTSPKPPPPNGANGNLSTNGSGSTNGSAATPSSTDASVSASESKATAVIGPKIHVRGELVGEEDILVQGQVDGLIDLKDHTLTIGQQGVVNANVLAKTITIEGTVEGDLFGQERISILSSSNVQGNLVADRVILEDGAKFRGSIDMDVESHKDSFDKLSPAPGVMLQPAQAPAKPPTQAQNSSNNSQSSGGKKP